MPHDHHVFGHIHGPGLHHNHESDLGAKLRQYVFTYDPSPNAIIAVSLMTAMTQTLIAFSPKLSGYWLQFLVAYAEGSMLATVFIHMSPEIRPSSFSSLMILTGFLLFVMVDKVMRIFSGSHTHAHSHSLELSPKNSNGHEEKYEHKHDQKNDHEPEQRHEQLHDQKHEQKHEHDESAVTPWLNVLADSLHNVTDGVSSAMSFHMSPGHGVAALMVMGTHEIPHQFGDFALSINSGMDKSVARKGQLITALGTLAGVLLGNFFGSLSVVLGELVTPLTAGVFIYVATVNVSPESLETDSKLPTRQNIGVAIVQLLGISAGICTLIYMDAGH